METIKILLVDDDPSFVEIYSAVFRSRGYNFSVAVNGAEALEKATQEKPNLILLDIMLPDINGLDVLKRLKRTPGTAKIPIWMISNLAEQINRETASSLGAVNYIFKGEHTPKQVCEKINAYFTNLAPQAQTKAQPPQAQ